MIGQRGLVSYDVHGLVFQCLDLIEYAQIDLCLPICLNLMETREQLNSGVFKVERLARKKGGRQKVDYALFSPPSTIILDSRTPFSNGNRSIPGLLDSLVHYSVTHELLHADDYVGGDRLLKRTTEHIFRDHPDELHNGMAVIEGNGGCDCIPNKTDLARLWAMQYVDTVAHYRAFVALRHRGLPMLDLIWTRLGDDILSPNLLTYLERHRGIREIFDVVTRRAGRYCLIEAMKECQGFSERNAYAYAV